jgi:hypothetical protein
MRALFYLVVMAVLHAPVEAGFGWKPKTSSAALSNTPVASEPAPPTVVQFISTPFLSTDPTKTMSFQFELRNINVHNGPRRHYRYDWLIYVFNPALPAVLNAVDKQSAGEWLKVPAPRAHIALSLEPLYSFMVAFTRQINPTRRGFAFKLVSEKFNEESEVFYMRDGVADILKKRRFNELARQALIDRDVEVLNQLAQMSQKGDSKDKEFIDSAIKKAASELIQTQTETNLIDSESNAAQ